MTATPPQYLVLDPSERGSALHLTFEDYKALARTALAITQNLPALMGIYCLPDESGCGLDIWCGNRCLTLLVNSELHQLVLLLSEDLDRADPPMCLLSLTTAPEDWRRISQLARAQLTH